MIVHDFVAKMLDIQSQGQMFDSRIWQYNCMFKGEALHFRCSYLLS